MSEGIERAWTSVPGATDAACQATVHIVERLAPGGIETLVLDMVGSGDGGVVFSLQGTRDELVDRWPALRPIGDRMKGFRRKPGLNFWLVPRLAWALRKINAKTVFLHHLGPLLYGGVAARMVGVPRVIFVEHDAWHYDNRSERLLTRRLVKLLRAKLVVVSQQVADRLRAIVPGRDVAVVPPGIDTERFTPGDKAAARQRLKLEQDWRVIGTVGRLHPVKGHRFLLEAAKALPDDVHVVLAGDGPIRGELEQLARDLDISARVHFVGHRDDLDHIYPAFDVFCLPSLSEGMPRSLLEAQAAGIPVIATAVGGVPEAVCDVSGLMVPAGDAKALAAALLQVLGRHDAVASPRAFVVGQMSLKNTVQRYRQLAEA